MFKLAAALAFAPLALCMNPQQMLAAPRRSNASPNPTGDWAVFTQTSYDWNQHASSTHWSLLNVKTGDVSVLFNGSDVSEIFWIGPTSTSMLYINGTNDQVDGGATLYMADARSPSEARLVASLPAPYAGLKAATTKSGDIHFIVNCLAYPNGTAYNKALVPKPLSTARIYDSIFVRHWNFWLTPERYALFSGTLKKSGNSSYGLSGDMKNLLEGIPAPVTRPETPVQPFGDQGDYDISLDGTMVAFLSKAAELTKANYTTSYIYLVPFDGSRAATAINDPKNPSTPSHARGASGQPRFSPNCKSIAYLQMDSWIYESDKNRIYVATLAGNSASKIIELASQWDSTPNQLQWGADGKSLYVAAPDKGNEKIFVVPLTADANYKAKNITQGDKTGSVAAFYVLPDGSALVSDSSIYSSRDFYTTSKDGSKTKMLLQAYKVDKELAGLGPEDMDQFYFQGNFSQVQSWIVYPEGFDKSKKYPLAFLVHGGPQGGWYNSWSTRWNYKTWADQGYVVIAPNPTGSTGWGMHFQDMIQNNWGSYPYDDLVKCWEYVAHSGRFPFIDTANGIAAGASYGGYMVNWIQGHNLGRKFKALVTHDGSTSTLNQYASDELWFMQHDFNGTLWDNRDNYERWDPLMHAKEFATPHYVVHSSLDYRLPESEGIMLFNVLQERGVPSRFLSFSDEGHWVLNRENSLVWHTEIYNWINHYSGLRVQQAIDTSQYLSQG